MLGEFVSQSRYDAMLTSARGSSTRWLDFDPGLVEQRYNRLPFLVGHRLNEHPLFSLESLTALCRRLGTSRVSCRPGEIPPDADFDTSLHRYNQGLTLEQALADIEGRQAYIAIYNPEVDPLYGAVIESLLGEIAMQTQELDPRMVWYSSYVFITARDSLTPYHMDREMNFLLQIRGLKTVRLWNPADDSIMSPAQKDSLLAYRGSGRPSYHPSFESKAMVYELEPGVGVHHPFIAPHLVRTGSILSISLALTYRTSLSEVWTSAHVFNHRMRRLGLVPRPVRESAMLDRAKASAVDIWRSVRRSA